MSAYAVTNPATGEQVKTFPTFTEDELDSAIALAYDTYQNWLRSSTVEGRAKLGRRVGGLDGEGRGGRGCREHHGVGGEGRWSGRSVRWVFASTSTASTRTTGRT